MALFEDTSFCVAHMGCGSPGSCGREAGDGAGGLPEPFSKAAATPAAARPQPTHNAHAQPASTDEAAARKRPRQAGRRVQFHAGAKTHDGLCDTSRIFHEYMKDVFRTVVRPGGETTVSILARKLNVLGLATMRSMLIDLILRCRQSPLGRAAVLHHGGGSAGSILAAHIPYLTSHVEYLDTVIGKVRVVIERNQARAAAHRQQHRTL